MGFYKFLLVLMRPYIPYASVLALIRPYESLRVLLRFYASLWVLIGPYSSLFVFMDFNEYLWVIIGFYLSLFVLMSPCGSLCVFLLPYGS